MTDERRNVALGLAEDLQLASSFISLTFHLRQMHESKSSMVRLAQDFSWFSMRAMRDSAVIHLWKIYDTQKSAHSLAWFLRNHSILDPKTKKNDIFALSTKVDAVRRLAHLRHQLFAHRGSEVARHGNQRILSINNVAEEEFGSLIQNAFSILRRHFGEPLPAQLSADSRNAADQLADLDIYLVDATRDSGGITRFPWEIDGDIKGSARILW